MCGQYILSTFRLYLKIEISAAVMQLRRVCHKSYKSDMAFLRMYKRFNKRNDTGFSAVVVKRMSLESVVEQCSN